MISKPYYLISQRKIPRLAIEEEHHAADIQLAFSAFQTYSLPGRFWRTLLRSAFSAGMSLLVSRKIPVRQLPLPPREDFEKIDTLLGNDTAYPVFQFPYNPERKKFSAFARREGKVYYLKCAFGPGSREELQQEIAALRRLSDVKFEKFMIPELVDSCISENIVAAYYEPLPVNTGQPKRWEKRFLEIWKELTEKTRRESAISEIKWIENLRSHPQWRSLLEDISAETLIISQNHGDFLPWNMRYAAKSWYLFDWEEAGDNAPFLYDPLHYFTVYETLVKKKSPHHIAGALTPFLKNCNYLGVNVADYVLLGLGFQFSNNRVLSKEVIFNMATAYKSAK
ncbi:MAG: hypothetical protein CV087_21570 [Candidatus Brocadia sp. WS118]|nr:MAG: hypothetical protein CV087_21570 [Candidatus Brocadia sp. WS118]